MPRQPLPDAVVAEVEQLLDTLSSREARSLPPDSQLVLLNQLRSRSPESTAVDLAMLAVMVRQRQGLLQAREYLHELEGVVQKLRFTPWYPAVFLGDIDSGTTPAALVVCNSSLRVVGFSDDVDETELNMGDEVLLGQNQNVIMRKSPVPVPRTGETAEFLRVTSDNRLVLRHRDEEVIVRAAHGLNASELAGGERVRWDRATGLAFEPLPRDEASHLFLEDTPAEGFDHIGGLDRQIAELQRSLRMHMLHPEIAARYRIRRATSVLLVGPPGTGKTMMARALANWLAAHSSSGRSQFMAIKPAELHSMWYGQSEANYREAFRVARQAGDREPSTPVVMFFDEVDGIGRARGHSLAHVDDRVLTSFMTELDGLQGRGNILVVAATNRRDSLDPALARPGRLGDLIVDIPRPNRAAARAVFDKHLALTLPYAGDGETAIRRQQIIDAAVSRLYVPNGEGEVARIMFRDGTRRSVHARDLMSGAHIANIARAAIERACSREIDGVGTGLTVNDVLDAAATELTSVVTSLTPANCHAFVSDLPQDLGIARVEPVVKAVKRPHRFINVA